MPSDSNKFEASNVDYGPASTIVSGGRITAAFPAYRVFIFGREVTSDVLDVRVNNSGGSAERSAGTCSFTLVNPDNKYTLTYGDMLTIAQGSTAYREARKKHWEDNGFGGTTPLEVRKVQMAVDLRVTEYSVPEEHQKFAEDYIQQGRQAEIPQQLLDQMKAHDESVVEGKERVDAAYKAIAENLMKTSYLNPFSALNLDAWSSEAAKDVVLKEKLVFHSKVEYTASSNLSKLEETQILMAYPFQQGDCIFSPNDPVRVAFRDPFDPRVWYWMFAGFMDAWTENSGVNMDSTITINCTDVTKMARYSYIQIGVGLQDPDIADVFAQLDAGSQASKQVQYFGELFAFFTMLEALNALFFGTESAQATAEDVILAQVPLMSESALQQYLVNLDPTNPLFVGPEKPENLMQLVTEAKSEKIRKLIAQAGKIPPLSVPAPFMRGVDKGGATTGSEDKDYNAVDGTVIAKKKSDRWGVHAYFYGAMTAQDKALGEELVSLNGLNKMLHHRVQAQDLVDMALNEAMYTAQYLSTAAGRAANVITTIGEGKKSHPVGHGRVYYVSRAQLADGQFGRNIIDKSMGGNSGLFSIFKDKLSYIYDMVDRVDFRFYATPKGDFVYEMPFYDFDPIYFTSASMEDWEQKSVQMQEFLTMSGSEDIPFSARDLEAIGFYKDYEEAKDVTEWSATGPYDYQRHFTIEREEQLSFSNTATDQGVVTACRCRPQNVAGLSAVSGDIKKYQYATDAGAVSSLGVRVADVDSWGFITSEEEAQMYAALMLARLNAEAKNVSVSTLPKFGLMVNRPIFWRERNYFANIVSLQHSIVWNSSADTTINMNQLRGWSGETHKETGYPIHKHFSGSDRPFSMGEMSTQSTKNQNTQSD